MEFFNSAVNTLQTIVIGLGGGLCVWGGVNLLEGYGQDNPGAKSQGVKHLMPNKSNFLTGLNPVIDFYCNAFLSVCNSLMYNNRVY